VVIIMGGGPGGPGGSGGPDGDGDALPQRAHFHPKAVRWRVVAGKDLLHSSSPPEGEGEAFDVHLKPGSSFERVKVQWQDAGGKWHPH
jgi:hypothetical protein